MPLSQDKVKSPETGQEICIIFSRYPRPGSTKTRLVPLLGRQGAADLQRHMTEKVVSAAAKLAGRRHAQVELAMADAHPAEMASWLGRRFPWQQQVGGDLGERMAFAFDQAFGRGFRRVVLVGSDCPQLSTAELAGAFQALVTRNLVLGPSLDGGYYLIGLSRPIPSLFRGISWGSGLVLTQTLAAAARAHHEPVLLTTLPDVDRPADLAALPVDLRWRLP